jgi:hypothetical protein
MDNNKSSGISTTTDTKQPDQIKFVNSNSSAPVNYPPTSQQLVAPTSYAPNGQQPTKQLNKDRVDAAANILKRQG